MYFECQFNLHVHFNKTKYFLNFLSLQLCERNTTWIYSFLALVALFNLITYCLNNFHSKLESFYFLYNENSYLPFNYFIFIHTCFSIYTSIWCHCILFSSHAICKVIFTFLFIQSALTYFVCFVPLNQNGHHLFLRQLLVRTFDTYTL